MRLLEGGGERAELELIAGEIRELLLGGMAAEEIALVARIPGTNADLLEEVLTGAGVPYALERRVPFGDTAIGAALLGLLRCVPGAARADAKEDQPSERARPSHGTRPPQEAQPPRAGRPGWATCSRGCARRGCSRARSSPTRSRPAHGGAERRAPSRPARCGRSATGISTRSTSSNRPPHAAPAR